MKHLFISVFLITFLGMHRLNAQKKESKELIKREISFENMGKDNLLVVKNIRGDISVEGYDGDVILLEVEKVIQAMDPKDLELGKKEIDIKTFQNPNRTLVHVDAPFITIGEDGEIRFKNGDEELPYNFILNFKLKVPAITNLKLATGHVGGVSVEDTKGSLVEATSIHGEILLKSITGQTNIYTVNGDINASYADNPNKSSSYFSLNGDINISYQKDLSADLSFKSKNGEFFTDFDITKQYKEADKVESGNGSKSKYVTQQVVQLEKGKINTIISSGSEKSSEYEIRQNESGEEGNENNPTKYQYQSKQVVQIGNGGLIFDFETFSGNVRIKKM